MRAPEIQAIRVQVPDHSTTVSTTAGPPRPGTPVEVLHRPKIINPKTLGYSTHSLYVLDHDYMFFSDFCFQSALYRQPPS